MPLREYDYSLLVAQDGMIEQLTDSLIHASRRAHNSGLGSFFAQDVYHASVLPMAAVLLVLVYLARPAAEVSEKRPESYGRFQATYLAVWSLCVGADWLQGPYVYALYQAYGYQKDDIAKLFLAGFGASAICSCFVGSFVDSFGRKRSCMAYCLLYMVSCFTKHFQSYWILMIGRITGGFATSLLFSSFECWMVAEHLNRHHFSKKLLSHLFAQMFSMMYVVAILSGFAAQAAADSVAFGPLYPGGTFHIGGNCSPFDLAASVLCLAFLVIALTWEENYGGDPDDDDGLSSFFENCKQAMIYLFLDPNSAKLCIIISCFEGAMYAFVFNWTPALQQKGQESKLPEGVIFSLFMMAAMSGASFVAFSLRSTSPSLILRTVCAGAAMAFVVAAGTAGVSGHSFVCLLAFLAFEFCVGAYFPAIGVLKSEIVPEMVRGTMYNYYRLPLNLIVMALLLSHISLPLCFLFCAALTTVAWLILSSISSSTSSSTSRSPRSENAENAEKAEKAEKAVGRYEHPRWI
eukprot:TRINITY_DN8352_c2_g1_i1.p1 TRINITY_DN8352_c2_g1~~TRINITY_DN8352_c2_g1_i1.p1  ORF type:complete len:519 (-),score=52.73 TRINITY_DN8352_c2_g1_i1:270-1826(-)